MRPLSEIERNRIEKVRRLREAGSEPYPARVRRTHTTAQALAAFAASPEGKPEAAVAGRLRSIRTMGKATFAHLEDASGRLQIYLRADELGPEMLRTFADLYDLGDFIQAEGYLFATRTGEVTLHVRALAMLAKSITPLPAAKEDEVDGKRVVYSAFDNPEARYRERYADLALNPDVRDVFRARAKVVTAVRSFLDGLGFVEVETPILQPIYGGAAARPFVTHHNQLHQDLYLRISFELYLKRLLVGGLERVYEIGRDFRNEGVSFKHNPEFTQLEFYVAYADYRDVMTLTEELVSHTAQAVRGTMRVAYQGQTLDFTPPWRRVDLNQIVGEASGIDLRQHPTAEGLAGAMREHGHSPTPGATRGKLIESLLAHYVEPSLVQPTFVYDYPRDISPLAKIKPGDPQTVERFEGFVAGMELCNAFTELNDPLDQESRFDEMARMYGADDEDRNPLDEDYLNAMRYGMPPNGGFGMGLDRLTMLLTDQATIREVILFPHLRSREEPRRSASGDVTQPETLGRDE
ncbi:MAG: lysine--tRNA ligase [Chloroflexi bacterium RBG_16_64_43]|nr:MAG: lysine--tRNA ligase [Chloroflexi bacterium RBG_16_64_43]